MTEPTPKQKSVPILFIWLRFVIQLYRVCVVPKQSTIYVYFFLSHTLEGHWRSNNLVSQLIAIREIDKSQQNVKLNPQP